MRLLDKNTFFICLTLYLFADVRGQDYHFNEVFVMTMFKKAVQFDAENVTQLKTLQVGNWVLGDHPLKGIWCGFDSKTGEPIVAWRDDMLRMKYPTKFFNEQISRCKLVTFELYQNKGMSRENSELINRYGLEIMFERVPAIKSAWKSRHDGSESFKAKDFTHWAKVCDIKATDIEDAFYQQNNPYGLESCENRLTRYASQWSMSVGDIVKEGNVYYMCDSVGWTRIEVA